MTVQPKSKPKPKRGAISKYARGDVKAPLASDEDARRKELMVLMNDMKLGQQEVADALSEETGDKISLVSVQRWLADSSKNYARSCPGWPIAILQYRAARLGIIPRNASAVRGGAKIMRRPA